MNPYISGSLKSHDQCSQCHTQRNSQWFSTGDTILKSQTLKSGSPERIRYWNRGISGFSKFIQILIVFIPFSETTSYQVAKFPTIKELVRNSNKCSSSLIRAKSRRAPTLQLRDSKLASTVCTQQTCKLATQLSHCLDLCLLLLFQGLEIWGNPWWSKNGSTAFKEIQGHGTQHEGQHCFHTLDAKICILKKSQPNWSVQLTSFW